MGYSLEEFSRTLNGGFAAPQSGFFVTNHHAGRWTVTIPAHQLAVEITATPAAYRQLGAMMLPVLEVILRFTPDDENGRRHFLDRFWRYFHKGGG